jgi:type II secretory pathway pseudopilin PulG
MLLPVRRHAGITLLEVLISIGILAIGLSSLVALMPAARSQAERAVVLNHAGVLAGNALADAATFGMLRSDSLTVAVTATVPVIVDPAAGATNLYFGAAGTAALAQVKAVGVFATSTATAAAASTAADLFARSADDPVVGSPAVEEGPPVNAFVDGARSYAGRISCLYCIRGGEAGAPGTLSVVVFHARDPMLPVASGTVTDYRATLSGPLGDRTPREIIRVGSVLYGNGRFHRIAAAAFDASGSTAYLTLSTGNALGSGTVPVQFLPDSVGLAERPFTPETAGPYSE